MANSRIRRRNECGFKGVGNHSHFPIITCRIEDYKLVGAYDGIHKQQVHFVKLQGFKHPGSKPYRKIINIIQKKLRPYSRAIHI